MSALTYDGDLEYKSLSFIKELLEDTFGENWVDLEDETLTLESDVIFSDLLLAKVRLLRVLEDDPDRLYDDAMFFLHSVDIANNHEVDPEGVPVPTSLELAYALTEFGNLAPLPDTPALVKHISLHVLKDEGYSEPVPPFSFIESAELENGQLQEDILDKKKAVLMYIRYMDEL